MNFKEKNKQINKEAKITVALYVFFFIWWFAFSYGIGLKDISEYQYILGFPSWFFYSCILGYVMISALLAFVVKKHFKDIDFDDSEQGEIGIDAEKEYVENKRNTINESEVHNG